MLDRVDDPYIHVEPGPVTEGGAWRTLDLPLRMHGKHYIDLEDGADAIVLEPGQDLTFAEDAGLRVDSGGLRAIGTEEAPVTMTGVQERPGGWEALVVQSGSPDNLVEHARIAHGGAGEDFSFSGQTAALIVVRDGGMLKVVDTVLEDSADACVAVDEDSELDTSELETTNCAL